MNITTNVSSVKQNSHTKMFEGESTKILQFMRTFGSKCYVTNRNKSGKYEERAKTCFMMGYAVNHAPDCYRLYDPHTNKIILSRDVVWDENVACADVGLHMLHVNWLGS